MTGWCVGCMQWLGGIAHLHQSDDTRYIEDARLSLYPLIPPYSSHF
jgi:hypothetical protein